MKKIKLDENLGNHGKNILISNGFNVETVYDEGICSISDHDLINICKKEKRTLITLDLDFSNPFIFKPSDYYGIAVIRLSRKPTLNELKMSINYLAKVLIKNDIKGKLWIIQKNIVREYQEDT